MARFGSFTFGDGTQWGHSGLTTPQQDAWDALAGQSPYFPSHRVTMRERCAELWSFNPTTWTPTAILPYVARGGVRQASLLGLGFQQESLSFPISNAQYYYDNPSALASISPGAYVCVRWEVATPLAATAHLGGVFQIVQAPSRERLSMVSSFTVQAVDWGQPAYARASGSGWLNYPAIDQLRLAYVAAADPTDLFPDMDDGDDEATWGTLLAAFLREGDPDPATTRILIPTTWPTWGPVPEAATSPSDESGLTYLQIGDPGKPHNAYDNLAWFWPTVGGFYLAYDSATGYRTLLPGGNRAADSGCFIDTDGTVGGSTPLPWASPLSRSLQRPETTLVEYWLIGPSGNTPGVANELGGGTPDAILTEPTKFRGRAVSSHPEIPYNAAYHAALQVVEEGEVQVARGFRTFTEWCEWRLRQSLGAADTITLQVDAAFPPPPLGTLVRVHAPDDVDGWYQLTAFTQPLSEVLGNWSLRWWSSV